MARILLLFAHPVLKKSRMDVKSLREEVRQGAFPGAKASS
jgi:hypothetical protein